MPFRLFTKRTSRDVVEYGAIDWLVQKLIWKLDDWLSARLDKAWCDYQYGEDTCEEHSVFLCDECFDTDLEPI